MRSADLRCFGRIVDTEKNEYLVIFVEASKNVSLDLVELNFDIAKLTFFLVRRSSCRCRCAAYVFMNFGSGMLRSVRISSYPSVLSD
jgi:hypothetical protein